MDYIIEGKNRLVNNSIKSFEGMTAQRWIRIILIVGAYMLVRPYLLKAAANRQKAALEREQEDLGLGGSGPTANDLRGGVKKPTTKRTTGGGKVLGEVKDD